MNELTDLLDRFASDNKMLGKGALSLALIVTRHAQRMGLPVESGGLVTAGRGQVVGMGKSAVQSILQEYGIVRVLAAEGGRTNRGNQGKMESYVEFLNHLHSRGQANLDVIERWWIDRVQDYFAGQPFTLRFDPAKSLRAIIRDVLEQAQKRQEESPGATFAGTVLQHLIGAKLDLLRNGDVQHYGASVADEALGREGDFVVGDVSMHVTTSPGEAVVRRCAGNLEQGLRPMILTTSRSVLVAEALAEQSGIKDRIDVMDAEQFLAGNLHELGGFVQSGRRSSAQQLIKRYNELIEANETDPSLKISMP